MLLPVVKMGHERESRDLHRQGVVHDNDIVLVPGLDQLVDDAPIEISHPQDAETASGAVIRVVVASGSAEIEVEPRDARSPDRLAHVVRVEAPVAEGGGAHPVAGKGLSRAAGRRARALEVAARHHLPFTHVVPGLGILRRKGVGIHVGNVLHRCQGFDIEREIVGVAVRGPATGVEELQIPESAEVVAPRDSRVGVAGGRVAIARCQVCIGVQRISRVQRLDRRGQQTESDLDRLARLEAARSMSQYWVLWIVMPIEVR